MQYQTAFNPVAPLDIDLGPFLQIVQRTDVAEAAPLPVPEVIESNDDSVWALWQDSVSFQDSQFETL